jgi:ribosomal protein S18 acetylase RimI-like enzyme
MAEPAPLVASDAVTVVRLPAHFSRWTDLLELILASFRYMNGVIDPPSSALRLTPESLAAKAQEEIGFIAIEGETLVGCVFLAERDDHFYLGKLAVLPSRQGCGVGRRLIAAAEDAARATGKPAIELQTRVELVANQAAFLRLGFRETGRTAHAGHDRPTSVTMRKELQACR